MEAREQDLADAEQTAPADTASEGAMAPETADAVESNAAPGAGTEAHASDGAAAGDAADADHPEASEAAAADAPAGSEAEAPPSSGEGAETAGELDAASEPEVSESHDDAQDPPLELVELELALSLADIPAAGFDVALRAALASAGGTLLFIMPSAGDDQSIAAVSLGSGEVRETFLAILGADGQTVRFERAAESHHPVAGLAASWTRVMERMPDVAA